MTDDMLPPGPSSAVGPADAEGSTQPVTMIRSEERLRADVVEAPYARAVLVVDTVTEEILVPVTVRRQQVRVEQRPVTGSEPVRRDTETPWVTLYVEEPVVTLAVRPIERVRLSVRRVDGAQTVHETLRHEEIVVETSSSPIT